MLLTPIRTQTTRQAMWQLTRYAGAVGVRGVQKKKIVELVAHGDIEVVMHLAAARGAVRPPPHMASKQLPQPAPAAQLVGRRSIRREVGRTVGVIERVAGGRSGGWWVGRSG